MKKSDTGREELIDMLVETLTAEDGAGADLPPGEYDELDERLWLQGYQGSLDVGQLANVILRWTDTL